MQMTLGRGAKVIAVLMASAYLFAGIASLMHFHGDSADHSNCPLVIIIRITSIRIYPAIRLLSSYYYFKPFPLQDRLLAIQKLFLITTPPVRLLNRKSFKSIFSLLLIQSLQ